MNVIWFHSKSSLFMSDSDRCIGEWWIQHNGDFSMR
jgi:hypothetical protein